METDEKEHTIKSKAHTLIFWKTEKATKKSKKKRIISKNNNYTQWTAKMFQNNASEFYYPYH